MANYVVTGELCCVVITISDGMLLCFGSKNPHSLVAKDIGPVQSSLAAVNFFTETGVTRAAGLSLCQPVGSEDRDLGPLTLPSSLASQWYNTDYLVIQSSGIRVMWVSLRPPLRRSPAQWDSST